MNRHLEAEILIIEDLRIKALPPKADEILLEHFLRRNESRSTIMISNRPVDQWGQLLNEDLTAKAILDRFLFNAELIHFTGRVYLML